MQHHFLMQRLKQGKTGVNWKMKINRSKEINFGYSSQLVLIFFGIIFLKF
jgi:hypothetical protein